MAQEDNSDYSTFLHHFISRLTEESDCYLEDVLLHFNSKYISQFILNPNVDLNLKIQLICSWESKDEFTYHDNMDYFFAMLESFKNDLFFDLSKYTPHAGSNTNIALQLLFAELDTELLLSEIRFCKVIADIIIKYHDIDVIYLGSEYCQNPALIIESIFKSSDNTPLEIGSKVQTFIDTLRNDNNDIEKVLAALKMRLSTDIMENVDNMPPKAPGKRTRSDQNDTEDLDDHTKRHDDGSSIEAKNASATPTFEDTLLAGADNALPEGGE